MCGSMVDIQSAAAEIRRGIKEDRILKETTGQKYTVRICYAGRPCTMKNQWKTPVIKLVHVTPATAANVPW